MVILLTNDDGIHCQGLTQLAEALRAQRKHRICVFAPDSNRSGVSHSISLSGPVRIKRHGEDTWSCSGTPADCAIIASLGGLPVKPDLIVSGINVGPNIGTDLIYSGTAAAARQGAVHDIPSVALSLAGHHPPLHWDAAVSAAAEHLEEFAGLWVEDTFVNVNLPNLPGPPEGIMVTFPSRRHYHDSLEVFDAPDGHRYCFMRMGQIETEAEEGSDMDAVLRGFISVSPVFIHPVVRRDVCENVPDHSSAAPRPGSILKKG